MIPAQANGQPALVAYSPDDAGVLRLHTLQVLTVTSAGVAHNAVLADPRVLEAFQLAQVLEPGRLSLEAELVAFRVTEDDHITIDRQAICAICQTEQEVADQVRRTVIHEVAHHFGIDDKRLGELGW